MSISSSWLAIIRVHHDLHVDDYRDSRLCGVVSAADIFLSQVSCHGQLYKKQVSDGHGRKSSARNWKPFYTVLVGSHMVFYKDKKDADAVSSSPPILYYYKYPPPSLPPRISRVKSLLWRWSLAELTSLMATQRRSVCSV